MTTEKLRHFAYLIITLVGGGALVYFAATRLLTVVLPFFIGWALAFAVRPVSHKLTKITKLPVKFSSLIFSLLLVLGVGTAAVGIIVYAVREAWSFLSSLATGGEISVLISKLIDAFQGIFGEHEYAQELKARIADALREVLSSLLSRFVEALSGFVGNIPSVVLFIFTSVVATVYFSLDLSGINARVLAALPAGISEKLVSFKNKFLLASLSYLRSYLVIMALVFSVLLVGFLIMRVKYALLLALVFALLDMLPLLGVGSFMIPWALFELAFGRVPVGIGLIVLFVVTEVTRNLLEPKIVGKSLGLHPILTLAVLYGSFSFFGFWGLLLTPLLTVILNTVINKDDAPEVGKRMTGE